MPRDIPLGNGSLLVTFDSKYRVRDIYWPHVGQENHSLGHPFRLGFWVEGEFRWIESDGWQRELGYENGTLVSHVSLSNPELEVGVNFSDAVDFHENVFLRRLEISNLANETREIRVFFHHDFHVGGNEIGDTAYYEPDRRSVIHYKGPNWFLINGALEIPEVRNRPSTQKSDEGPELLTIGIDQWACGLKEIHNLQGTWRDAEDGELSGDSVAHGSVDSTVGFQLRIPAGETHKLYYWIAVGEDFESVARINRLIRKRGPQNFLDRTRSYWTLWLKRHLPDYIDLPEELCREYETSLLILRTQIDNGGAIIAANDTDISSAVRDTYSYMWPRDGALVARALIQAGYMDLSRAFFEFCKRALTKEGYLLHKYNPDGTLASSWHPWTREGKKSLPIQEDESALVLWALWEHFEKFGDVEFIKPFYRTLITPIADFLVEYRFKETGLPLPSYDLWEERYGTLAWTTAATYGGLIAGANFAESFGDHETAQHYLQAADEMRSGADQFLWKEDLKCFARMLFKDQEGEWVVDEAIDASLAGLWMFGMYAVDDPKIRLTNETIQDKLWVKTVVGGVARYSNDRYHQVSEDIDTVPGNPWFISTLWLAEWHAHIAESIDDLDRAKELLTWASEHALPSGVLAEQVNPFTNEPLSVSPLTWSHATFVSTSLAYLSARKRLG
jgi:GH15 family glucan-1,4-alpha-glucosidase